MGYEAIFSIQIFLNAIFRPFLMALFFYVFLAG